MLKCELDIGTCGPANLYVNSSNQIGSGFISWKETHNTAFGVEAARLPCNIID